MQGRCVLVDTLSHSIVLFSKISFAFPLTSSQAHRLEEEASRKAKLILETTTMELERALKKITKVEARYDKLHAEYESLSENLQMVEEKEKEEAVWSIRDTKAKGKPMKGMFVGHCRTLLATGASARSVREQLYLNAKFFLTPELYADFDVEMPSLRWFQFQREGMGYESMVYSFIRIAQCEEVVMWGFDETSLNGIPTLNQWCRIKEKDEYVNVTIECAGLLVGSTSTMVAEHVRVTWERAQSVIATLRTALGEKADNLVPLVNGGVTLAKLRGVMHDTCNTANLIATKVRVVRDNVGKNMFGEDEWQAMQEHGYGWQDFLCGNHSRNLHFDAMSRRFTAYVKAELGEGMAVCKVQPLPTPYPLSIIHTFTYTLRLRAAEGCALNQTGRHSSVQSAS